MPAQIAYNLEGLTDREILQKIENAHDAVAGHAATFATPNPPLATIMAAHDAAETTLDTIDAREQELTTLRETRESQMAAALQHHRTLGSYVESRAAGNPAIITEGGFDLVQPRSGPQAMPQVQNNSVTSGDNDGEADASWNSVKGAKSYELQTAGASAGPWTHEATITVSHKTLSGKTSGQKLWTRVRAVNSLGPGPWSDPACCTVP